MAMSMTIARRTGGRTAARRGCSRRMSGQRYLLKLQQTLDCCLRRPVRRVPHAADQVCGRWCGPKTQARCRSRSIVETGGHDDKMLAAPKIAMRRNKQRPVVRCKGPADERAAQQPTLPRGALE